MHRGLLKGASRLVFGLRRSRAQLVIVVRVAEEEVRSAVGRTRGGKILGENPLILPASTLYAYSTHPYGISSTYAPGRLLAGIAPPWSRVPPPVAPPADVDGSQTVHLVMNEND